MAFICEWIDTEGKEVMLSKALQLYYTSSRRGVSGYPGFQTYSESAGMQLDDRREIEAKSLYQPPRDLPHEPDSVLIEAQFPKSFRTFQLSSGRFAIVHSVYTGQDYSGRWGNYFAHALVFDEVPAEVWPIDAYAWQGWMRSLVDDSAEKEPEPLPSVSAPSVLSGEDFSFSKLKAFLAEGERRTETLAAMLDAVLRWPSESRSVVIREELELDGVYWVACIQKAFPRSCQTALSSSTFQFDPRNALGINVTIGETDFLFDDEERDFQFYLFDFVTGRHSALPAQQFDLPQTLAGWMAQDPDRMTAFHRFAGLFTCTEINTDLESLINLFRLRVGENVSFPVPELHAILKFVSTNAKPDGFGEILKALGDVTGRLDSSASLEDWIKVIRFLADGAANTGEAVHRQMAWRGWLNAFDLFVVEKQVEGQRLRHLRHDIETQFAGDISILADEMLSDTHLDKIFARAAEMSVQTLGDILIEIEECCQQSGLVPTHNAAPVQNLIEVVFRQTTTAPSNIDWVFEPYLTNADGLFGAASHLINVVSEEAKGQQESAESLANISYQLGISLNKALSSLDEERRFEVLNRLKIVKDYRYVLVGEWEHSIDSASDKISAHELYAKKVLIVDSDFATEFFELIARKLLKKLGEESQRIQAERWIETGAVQWFSDGMAAEILSKASYNFNFDPDDRAAEAQADRIKEFNQERGLALDPDRVLLRDVIGKVLFTGKGHDALQDALERTDDTSYKEAVDFLVPRLLLETDELSKYEKAIRCLTVKRFEELLSKVYQAHLERCTENRYSGADKMALAFWFCSNEDGSQWSPSAELKQSVRKALAARMANLRGKAFAAMENDLSSNLRVDSVEESQGFLQQVRELQPSLIGRIKSFVMFNKRS